DSSSDVCSSDLFVKNYGAKGLAWLKVNEEGLQGPIAKFFDDAETTQLQETLNYQTNDLILFVADKASVVHAALGNLRNKLAKDLGLIDDEQYNFICVTYWPLL